jgi:hypothetical protein
MKYDQKALYAELTHFYLSICEKEQLDEPRIRGLVGSLVRKARRKFKIADLSGEFPDPTDFTCRSRW